MKGAIDEYVICIYIIRLLAYVPIDERWIETVKMRNAIISVII